MISQTVEYSLRAVVTLAQNDGNPRTAQQISEVTQVPGPYLSKLMQVLVRSGLVQSQRGLHGGFVLTKRPDQLTILEVVNAVEPLKRIRECPLKLASHGRNLCPLHRRLDKVMAMAEEAFGTTTLAELLHEPGSVTPLCETVHLIPIGRTARVKPRKSKSRTS
jgi:Rrf2 family protein